VQTTDEKVRVAYRIFPLHKPHTEAAAETVKGQLQMGAYILRLHGLVLRQIMAVRLHFQIVFLILFLQHLCFLPLTVGSGNPPVFLSLPASLLIPVPSALLSESPDPASERRRSDPETRPPVLPG